MVLKKLHLHNFRSFEENTFYFNPLLTVIIGKNSVGKTNLIEALYCILKGRGIKEEKQNELLMQHAKKTTIEGEFVDDTNKVDLLIELEDGEIFKKLYAVNGIKKRLQEYHQSTIPVVIFTPNLVDIIDGEPSLRRKFIDSMIAIISIEYRRRLRNYETGLYKRNKILERVKDMSTLKQELIFWDDYLIEQAQILSKMREETIVYLNAGIRIQNHTFRVEYIKNEISKETLSKTFEKQWYVKKTVVGPQRDLYHIFKIEKTEEPLNVHTFGSRSEQRLALFWLILNEMRLYQEKLGHRPLLLLDDIFSELDSRNRSLVLDLIKKYQTVLTTTDKEILNLHDIPNTIISL